MTASDGLPTSVEDAATMLYGLPVNEFVARRNELAKEVRAGGDRALADAVKALRKPTVVADALNRALRREPAVVEDLLDAVAELRRTQNEMLAGESGTGGGAGSFAAAQAAYRAAVDAVVALAPGHHVEVRAAVEAAAIGGLDGELRAATFAVAPQPEGGFGPFVAGAGRDDGPGAGRPGTTTRRAEGPDPSARRSSDRSTRQAPSAAHRRLAERARKAAEQALADAEAGYQAAEQAAAGARTAVEALDEQLEELTAALDDARRARDDAVAVRAAADASLATAREKREQAQAALRQLDAD